MWNIFAPLFCEKQSGIWKMSLGRISFWIMFSSFIIASYTFLFLKIDPQLLPFYSDILSKMFYTVLGLLGYNLGSKFTTPFKDFVLLFTSKTSP